MTDSFKQQNYFSALARGGLTAALNFNNQNKSSPNFKENVRRNTSDSRRRRSSSSKRRKQAQINKENQKQYQYQRKLQSLMIGSDLQPLEEEVSKEEDESMIIRLDAQQNQQESYQNMKKINQASLASIESCDYQAIMDETEVMFEITNANASMKIFDPQFQNSSYDKSQSTINTNNNRNNPLKDQQDYMNQQQKQKAKDILEQLKHSQVNQQTIPVEQRLFEYQKKTLEKLEYQRKEKENQELKQLKPIPNISQKSNEIIQKKSLMISHSLSPNGGNCSPKVIDYKNYYEEQKKKEEIRQKLVENQEMKGFTGKPIINKKSQIISRKVDDLLDWKEQQEKKREQELQKKLKQESVEIDKLQKTKVINKQSEKLLENKFRSSLKNEKVEERLLRDASARQKKQQQNNQLFTVTNLNEQKKRTRSKSQKPKSNHAQSPQQIDNVLHENKTQSQHSSLNQNQESQAINQVKQNNFTEQINVSQGQNQMNSTPQHQTINYHTQSPLIAQQSITQNSCQNLYQDIINQSQNAQQYQQVNISPFSQHSQGIQERNNMQSSQFIQQQMQQSFQNNNHLQQFMKTQAFQYQPNQQFIQYQPIMNTTPQHQVNQNQYQQFQQVQLQQQQPQHQPKKKMVIYESIFSKLQKMNTTQNQQPEEQQSSGRQSIQYVSAHQTQNSIRSYNPIYDQIQKDSQQNLSPSYQYQPLSTDQMLYQSQDDPRFQNTQEQHNTFMNSMQYPICNMKQQVFSQTMPSNFRSYQNQMYPQQQQLPYQDAIIHKILENSFIRSGNGKEMRRASLKEEDVLAYQQLNPINPSNQGQIMETEFSRVSEPNIVKNLNKVLSAEDHPISQRALSEQRQESERLKFIDRNNMWLEKKKNKIEKAKEILNEREDRQCPFKPQISQKPATNKQGKFKSNSSMQRSPRWFNQNSRETREEGVQVNVLLEASSIRKANSTNNKVEDAKSQDNNEHSSSHTTNKINEAIEMMNFEEGEAIYKTEDNESLDQQCDISCLSPPHNKVGQTDQSNFESESFVSVGKENEMFSKQPMAGKLKSFDKKIIKF